MQRSARMKREIQVLERSPPHGISCWCKDGCLDKLEAQILGGDDTPYSGGVFKLDVQIPERYPFEPPKVQFVTPIYHPNIDSAGRICLDSLKMPPKGAWKPSLNVSTILTSIQLLMAEPNPDDPLMTDIANEFKYKRPQYTQHAKEWTEQHAIPHKTQSKENDSRVGNSNTVTPSGESGSNNNALKRPAQDTSTTLSDTATKTPKTDS